MSQDIHCGGKLLYAVKRLPIGVYTDGESSIAELVEASYKESQLLAPWNRGKVPSLDAIAMETIHELGYDRHQYGPKGIDPTGPDCRPFHC